LTLIDIYTGFGEVLTGSARVAQEAGEKASEQAIRREVERRLRVQERKRNALEAKIAALRAEFDSESEEMHLMAEEERKRQSVLAKTVWNMADLRKGGPSAVPGEAREKEAERRVR
jgi:circadian clock protein KaiC